MKTKIVVRQAKDVRQKYKLSIVLSPLDIVDLQNALGDAYMVSKSKLNSSVNRDMELRIMEAILNLRGQLPEIVQSFD